jgi:hypothetical protein
MQVDEAADSMQHIPPNAITVPLMHRAALDRIDKIKLEPKPSQFDGISIYCVTFFIATS